MTKVATVVDSYHSSDAGTIYTATETGVYVMCAYWGHAAQSIRVTTTGTILDSDIYYQKVGQHYKGAYTFVVKMSKGDTIDNLGTDYYETHSTIMKLE